MRKKPENNIMETFGVVISVLIVSSQLAFGLQTTATASSPPPVTAPPNMETCQCGVFLLGTQPLVFSADAKPILSGMPVSANCSARDDKLQCASICRQLIETMSQGGEDSPLVQTVVLAATRTLACQRFNESERVPLPRTIDASPSHHAKLDGQTNKWKFMVGPGQARSDLGAEHQDDEENEEANLIRKLTQPKYLGGFYRWCDEHWIYAGVSLHEPLCCLQHLPKKCPPSKQSRNGRRPRLIIRRCKNEECSSEEDSDFQSLDLVTDKAVTTKAPQPTQSSPNNSEETESPDQENNNDENNEKTSSEVDTINPFDTTQKPVKNRKPLNSTAVAEAFKFFNSLMDSIGYGDVVEGITSVLPAGTAAELIDRVDVGGWVSNYQDRYMTWPREFSLGYCYMEYSLFNMANDGLSVTANNILNRLFKNQRSGSASPPLVNMNALNNGINMPPHHQPQQPSLVDIMPGSAPPVYPNNMNNVNNYISQIPDNGFGPYGPGPGLPGNRRVKRGVTVSRSYSGVGVGTSESTPEQQQPSTRPGSLRRVVRKRVSSNLPRARNVPKTSFVGSVESVPLPMEQIATTSRTTTSTTTTASPPTTTTLSQGVWHTEALFGNRTSFIPSNSFVPVEYNQNQLNEPVHPVPLTNPHYYQNQYYHYDIPKNQYEQQQQQHYLQNQVQRSHQPNVNQSPSLAEFARPRRNPTASVPNQNPNAGGYSYYPNQNYGPPPPPPRSRQAQPQQQAPKNNDGPSGASLLNIANMLVQTAMSGNNQNGGDQVTNIMQNAIPLVSQVATNPAIKNMVSSLVTSFLTPPQKQAPPPPTPKPRPTPPSQNLDDEYELSDDSNEESVQPVKPVKEPLDSNELGDNSITSSNQKPTTSSPPSGGGEGGMLPNLLSQMVNTYVKYLIGGGPNNGGGGNGPSSSSSSNNNKPSGINNRNPAQGPNKPQSSEPKDIVEMICNVAKPFFMSYFGVVPDDPGFGKLRINRNGNTHRHRSDKEHSHSPNDILTNDPDPGTGITDVLWGSPNIPETGSPIIDVGNRLVYAFHSANNAQHGLYCFKQYSVNKLWDYFRVGVKAVFKK